MLNILDDYASILIDEAELNAAYTTSTPYRGVLKTTFALTTAKFGLAPRGSKSIYQDDRHGFTSHLQLNPAPLVLVIADQLSSPASLASAVLTAKLAGVPQIIAVAPTHSSGVLASLDLAGLSILQPSTAQLLEIISRLPSSARILNFTAQTISSPVLQWQDRPKKIGFTCANYQNTLYWAQPQAEFNLIDPKLLQEIRQVSEQAKQSHHQTLNHLQNLSSDLSAFVNLDGLYHELSVRVSGLSVVLPQAILPQAILPQAILPQAPQLLSLHCPQLAGCWLNLDLTLDFFINQHLQFEFKEADLDP